MTYELAKELKEAGFPQGFPVPNDTPSITGVWFKKDEEMFYHPTLEELIVACGEDFDELISPFAVQQEGYPSHCLWRAEATLRTAICCDGSTPEEAVARLWLALKRKDTSTA